MTTDLALRIAFWILIVGVFAMRTYFSLQVRKAGERLLPDQQAIQQEGKGMFAARVVMFFLLLGWFVLYAINPTWLAFLAIPLPDWLRWLGFILGLASLGFWTWTQVALGKQWSPQLQLREEHHLVTDGPYTRIRHPLYTAMMGYFAGLAFLTANWVFLILAVLVILGSIARVPKEEQMMLNEFGDQYKAYMGRTGRFFPKIGSKVAS
jgi:protein-S-isoprenylcysteine O-methyltransferase Ste14